MRKHDDAWLNTGRMWLGGVPPPGYRGGIIVDSEAELVRSIFRRYALAEEPSDDNQLLIPHVRALVNK